MGSAWAIRHRRAVVALLLVVAAAGIGLRIWLWWTTNGTTDVIRWMTFGREISNNGLPDTYANDRLFNHPPLMGLYASAVWDVTGNDIYNFARGIRILGLLGEAIVLVVLARLAGLSAFVAYAAAPAAVLISGYHGNTDPLMAAFVLLAALAFDRKCYFTAGLAFGAALNVKLLPLVLLPLLFIGAPDRRALGRMCGALALAAVPFIPLFIVAPGDMYDKLIAYNSLPNDWGFLAFLNPAVKQPELHEAFQPIWETFRDYGRYLVLAAIVALALASRTRLHFSMIEQFAIGGALFLFLTSGFAVQYVLLIVALLILVRLRWGIAWAWLAGLFVAVFYSIPVFTDNPIRSDEDRYIHLIWTQVGVLAWALLAVFLWRTLSRRYVATREFDN